MPSASAWGLLRRGGGMAICPGLRRLGLNSLGDLDKDSSWWELLLQGEVRLVVGKWRGRYKHGWF